LEIAIRDIVPIAYVCNGFNLSQDRVNIAVDRRIFDRTQGLAGHGYAEQSGNLMDKIFSGLGHETYGIT
jgi:hypothetical protein